MQACDPLDDPQSHYTTHVSFTSPSHSLTPTHTRAPSTKRPAALNPHDQILPTRTRRKQTEVAPNVTLGSAARGGYVIPQRENPSPLGPGTPPSDSPFNTLEAISPAPTLPLGLTKEAGKGEEGLGSREELKRPEVRHHLVDIHGLAVFLRRATRCLSCRAAFCLYVTGKISAHLAAVTQVKITCQKCNYTTSQTLSKPAGVPSDSSPQPTPPALAPGPAVPPHDKSIPPPPPYPHPPPPYPHKSRHQTVIKLLKEENPSPPDVLLKGKEAFIPMPSLPPLMPIEKVWVKEVGKLEAPDHSPPKDASLERVEKEEQEVEEEDQEGAVSDVFDPLSTDWCQWSGTSVCSSSSSSSSSAVPPPRLQALSSDGGRARNRGHLHTTITTTTATSSTIGSSPRQHSRSPPALSFPTLPEPSETPTDPSAILQRRLRGRHEGDIASKGISMSSPSLNSTYDAMTNGDHSSVLPAVDGMFLAPSSSVFTVFSSTQTPYALPLAPSLLQSSPAAFLPPSDPSQQLQSQEITQKLERDLEESLRLVRRMIQLGPDSALALPTRDRKGMRAGKGVSDAAVSTQHSTSQESLDGSLGPGEELVPKGNGGVGWGRGGETSAGGSKRRRERRTKNKSTQMGGVDKKGGKGKAAAAGTTAGRNRKRDGGGGAGRSEGRYKEEEIEGNKRKRRKSNKTSIPQKSEGTGESVKGPPDSPESPQPTQEPVEEAQYTLKHSLNGGGGGVGDGDNRKKEQENDLQHRVVGEEEGGEGESRQSDSSSCRCCNVPHSRGRGGEGVERGGGAGVGEDQSYLSHQPHSSCKCCSVPQSSHSILPTPSSPPGPSPSHRGSHETLGPSNRLPGDSTSRRRLRKAKIEGPNGISSSPSLLHLISALKHASPPSPPPPPPPSEAIRDLMPSGIPDSVLDHLQRNLTHLVQKNSLKLALRSLVRRTTSRSSFATASSSSRSSSSRSSSSRARKYVKISVGVDEEEEETKEMLMRRISEEEGGGGQEEGRSASWRFHDLLSSDSDPDDGRLVIDTEH